ncbi:MAG: Chaperone protein DnaJ [uncultured Rubrobacteraceae bacterium]|uniref:Chaperone protein DnaJ n=1 Tax=uncultured Rubrobacteraceae bacterium TaxID=349277 RepID=A0A6J4Q6K2_9ACTN|nr:MAG: Chaperone protein DnaJ [uncultured Rubrobacteraceae bacterium]
METKDLYKVLEVSKGASQDEIRRSYRRLARKYHPDANPGDDNAEDRFKNIQQAYEVLSNPEKRREYDEGPRQFFGAGNAGQGSTTSADFQNFSDLSDLFGGFGNLGDVFGQATTGARRRQAPPKGEDATVSVKLNFKDALEGVTTRVGVPVEEACGDCGGSGAAPGTSPRTCPQCGGRGTQSRDQGLFALSTACSRCGGRGTIVETPCPRCRGNGKTRGVKQVKVRIPAGARNGMKVRVPGRGGAGRNGGPAGDLFVVTQVEEHPVFKRKGDDFVVSVPVSFVEAALGAEVEAPKPGGGTVRLRIPAGTQNGKQFKVRGAGAPKTRRGGTERGDLIVRVGVVVPKKLRRREREILEALAEERDEDVRAELFRRVGS